MKIISADHFNHNPLTSQKTGEVFSHSALVSKLLDSQQLFVHHDIIEPGRRSSGPHRHSIIEEIVYIVKGTASIAEGDKEASAPQGSLILFNPSEKEIHYLINKTNQNIETLTFSLNSKFDSVIFNDAPEDVQRPSSHFDQDLRDVPDDVDEWITFVDGLKAQLKTENHPAQKLKLFEHIGMATRTLLRFEEAEYHLKKAVALSHGYPLQSRLIQNLIRLAHVYQWMKCFEKAQLLFDQAKALMDECPTSESLQAAYHQHLGKLYFDQSDYAKAQAEFATALSIRKRISAPKDQLESSENSLSEALQRGGLTRTT